MPLAGLRCGVERGDVGGDCLCSEAFFGAVVACGFRDGSANADGLPLFGRSAHIFINRSRTYKSRSMTNLAQRNASCAIPRINCIVVFIAQFIDHRSARSA